MPANNPTGKGGKRFKKGQSGNPKGSSAKAKVLSSITRMTNEQLADIGSVLLNGTEGALEAIVTDPKASIMQKWIAKLIIHSMLEGDASVFNAVLNRIVGKVKERIEHTGADGDAISIRARMTIEEMEARCEAMRASRLEVGDD